MKNDESILAWHFVGDTLRDGRPIPEDGMWLRHEGEIEMCESGLHASRDPFDALCYAPGPILCRVECRGDVIEENDKLVCRERRIIQRRDATEGLRYFARMQALSVIHFWDPPDIVLEYLFTGHETARDAARYAARDAAWAAASAAARDAAWAAASAAAREAAWAAASAAARYAAWYAARDAAWDAARDDFNQLVTEAFEVAL